jgi:phosphatidylinositol alpha-1,6-mannosyltransferase
MKILILTESYRPETGGIAEYLSGFAGSLRAHEAQVHVLAATPGAGGFSTTLLPVTEFELPASGYSKRILACRRAVVKQVRKYNFDRVVTSGWSPFAVALPTQVNGKPLSIDIVCYGKDLLEPARSARYRFLMRHALRRAKEVIAISRYTANLACSLGAPDSRVVIIPPGVDTEHFVPGPPDPSLLSRYQIPPNVPVILSVGRLVERKGFDLVIRAIPRVLQSHPSAVYLIAGDGPDRLRLSKFASDMGLRDHVRFAGDITPAERPAHYRLASIFAMPNRLIAEKGDVEGFGMVFLEAAACELATLGGNCGGTTDAIEEGVTGYLIDPESAEDCAAKIVFLLSDSELRNRMGRAGRERARINFNWLRLTSRYLSAISVDDVR